LAIADLSERAAVLALDADRVRPLFRQAGVVERQNAATLRHQGPESLPHAADHGECVMKCCGA